jgi:hypothetical protein
MLFIPIQALVGAKDEEEIRDQWCDRKKCCYAASRFRFSL